jgi:hypothetical protein
LDALDGNAIAGPLWELYRAEMTTARGSCAHCGAAAQIAELRVYMRAPGAVARCRFCGNVVLVVTPIRGSVRVDVSRFRLLKARGES